MALHEQEAVYSAQSEVFPSWGRIFWSIDEVARYLSEVMDTEWFFTHFGPTPYITVREWKDRTPWAGCAIKSSFTLVLKVRGPIQESVVLHELAHLLCGEDGHGQCFVDTQLKLVRNTMGFQAYAEYSHALRKTGVFSAS